MEVSGSNILEQVIAGLIVVAVWGGIALLWRWLAGSWRLTRPYFLAGAMALVVTATVGGGLVGPWQSLAPYFIGWVIASLTATLSLGTWRYFFGSVSTDQSALARKLGDAHTDLLARTNELAKSVETLGGTRDVEQFQQCLDDVSSLVDRQRSAMVASISLDALRDDARRRLDAGWNIVRSDRDLPEKIEELLRWESDIDHWLESNPDLAGLKHQLAIERRRTDGYVTGGVRGLFPQSVTMPVHLNSRIHALANTLDQEVRTRRDRIAASLDDRAAS